MTEQELKEFLKEVGQYINVPKGKIDKGNNKVQEFITLYKSLTGKKVGEGTCKSCILDAYFELSMLNQKQIEIMLSDRVYKLKKTKVVTFNNAHYTNANITDEIAFQMLDFNISNSGNFENGAELLVAYELKNNNVQEEDEKVEWNITIPIEKKEVIDPAPVVKKKMGRPKKK